jgi:tetratricopeptide (TPR) repeat protein
MRKSIFTVLLAITTMAAFAQSVDDAKKQLEKKNLDKAKEIIDKLTADPNAKNAEAWYVKAQIYNTLAIDDKYKTTNPDAYSQAFDAFKKAVDIDPNNKTILLDLYKAGFAAYEGIANKAANAYKANDMQTAFDNYKKALEEGAYLGSKNLSFNNYVVPKLDTGMTFMAGYTAMKLKKDDDAIIYFTKLANAKIHNEVDYIIPYEFLAFHYKSAKDEVNFKKYTGLGRELYPKDLFFTTIMLDWARENNNYTDLFNTYEQLIAMQPDSMSNYLSYASEMFNYIFKDADKKPADFDAIVPKIESNLKVAISHNYETQNSNLILAQMYYNMGLDFATEADKIRSTKPDDVKKKKDFQDKAKTKYDLAIPYTENVAKELEAKMAKALAEKTNFKASEKATLRNMYLMLGEMYGVKGNKPKADEFNKKYTDFKN